MITKYNRLTWSLIIVFLAIIIASSLLVINSLVKDLSQEERKKIELWAEGISRISNLNTSDDDLNFTFEIIQTNTTVPVILTDEKDSIISTKNIPLSKIDTPEKANKLLGSMRNSHDPIVVKLLDSKINYIYYKDSVTLVKLMYFPYFLLFIIVVFLFITYFAFSQSRKIEQNNIWIGMAKETAHQLGTPTSSLLACLDILKDGTDSKIVANELEKDILRLEKIVDRFSKIGSVPTLETTNVVEVINKSLDYLKSRVSNKILFTKNYDPNEKIIASLNATLFEWVVENIVRNSVDAIQGSGSIVFNITDSIQVVYIDITDNGKGIPKSKFRKVFTPGYTTKSRGWGLGLSLSKRIVEEYHNGKIFINYSEINKGTSFRIALPKSS